MAHRALQQVVPPCAGGVVHGPIAFGLLGSAAQNDRDLWKGQFLMGSEQEDLSVLW